MPYFLSEENLSLYEKKNIAGPEARHILLSKRSKPGERILIQGPDGYRFDSEIVETGKDRLTIKPVAQVEVPAEPAKEVVLLQAIVAEQALDVILQKATELRATKTVLFNSDRAASRLSVDRYKSKKDRWNKILWEAAKQSERARPPELEFVLSFNEMVIIISGIAKVLLLDPQSNQDFKSAINQLSSAQSVGIIVGPEGGFTTSENQQLKSLPNTLAVNLGPLILRADTAAVASLAVLQSLI